MTTELLYFHDPMCSWCWAFRPAFTALRALLPAGLPLRRVVGGLAPDNDQPMAQEMRAKLKGTWQTIQDMFRDSLQLRILGTLRAQALDL